LRVKDEINEIVDDIRIEINILKIIISNWIEWIEYIFNDFIFVYYCINYN